MYHSDFLRTFYAENPDMPRDPAMDLEDSDAESDSGSLNKRSVSS